MSDRRRIIAALRAKAASTSFPAEAESLRSKADDLEAKLRAGEQSHRQSEPYAQSDSEWINGPVDWGKVTHQGQPWNPRMNVRATVTGFVRYSRPGDLFDILGGVHVRTGPTYTGDDPLFGSGWKFTDGEWVRVW